MKLRTGGTRSKLYGGGGEVVAHSRVLPPQGSLPAISPPCQLLTILIRNSRTENAIRNDETVMIVLVAAHAEDRHAAAVSLSAGDVIHAVNGASVSNIQELRAALDGLKPHSPVVLQIEREGLLSFVAFELE